MNGSQRSTRALAFAALVAAAALASAVLAAAGGRDGAATEGAAAPKLPVGRPLTIAWGGDTTLGSSHGLPPEHGWSALAGIARVLRAADLTSVNSEGTFSVGGSSKCAGVDGGSCFAFQAPPANAAALRRAGVDVANLANNHAFDYGAAGMGQTVRALRGHRIDVTGRPGEILVREIAGARVAVLGFSAYPWTSPIDDPVVVGSLIRRAASRANVVVALFHAGAEGAGHERTPLGSEEYLGENRGDVRVFARVAIDAGADLVLGSGPHVLRGLQFYRRRLIAYSLGNLAGFHTFATGGTPSLSGILRVTVDDDGSFLSGHFTSLELDEAGIPHIDRAGRAGALVNDVGRADFGRHAAVIAADGTVRGAAVASDPRRPKRQSPT